MVVLLVVAIALVLSLAGWGAIHLGSRRQRRKQPGGGARRILFPFIANALSQRALDAALRLARAEDATLVPVFLAVVPLQLPLDTPLPRQSNIAIPLQEAIERRATRFGIAVDARIERGRTYRHALRQTMRHERFDRIVVAAAAHDRPGFGSEDIAWILRNAPGEVVVLRPDQDEVLTVPSQPRRKLVRRRSRRAESSYAERPCPRSTSSPRTGSPAGTRPTKRS
ncbi:MAG: universal stress protein [Solirubrobacteraceae bacterium]